MNTVATMGVERTGGRVWLSMLLAWSGLTTSISGQILLMTDFEPAAFSFSLILLGVGLLTVAVWMRYHDAPLSRAPNTRERLVAGLMLVAYLAVSASYWAGWELYGAYDQRVWLVLTSIVLAIVYRRVLIVTRT